MFCFSWSLIEYLTTGKLACSVVSTIPAHAWLCQGSDMHSCSRQRCLSRCHCSPDIIFLGSFNTIFHASNSASLFTSTPDSTNFQLKKVLFLTQLSPFNIWLQWSKPLKHEYFGMEHAHDNEVQPRYLSGPAEWAAEMSHVCDFHKSQARLFESWFLHSD